MALRRRLARVPSRLPTSQPESSSGTEAPMSGTSTLIPENTTVSATRLASRERVIRGETSGSTKASRQVWRTVSRYRLQMATAVAAAARVPAARGSGKHQQHGLHRGGGTAGGAAKDRQRVEEKDDAGQPEDAAHAVDVQELGAVGGDEVPHQVYHRPLPPGAGPAPWWPPRRPETARTGRVPRGHRPQRGC